MYVKAEKEKTMYLFPALHKKQDDDCDRADVDACVDAAEDDDTATACSAVCRSAVMDYFDDGCLEGDELTLYMRLYSELCENSGGDSGGDGGDGGDKGGDGGDGGDKGGDGGDGGDKGGDGGDGGDKGGDGGNNRGSSAATVGATLFTVVSAVLVAVGN